MTSVLYSNSFPVDCENSLPLATNSKCKGEKRPRVCGEGEITLHVGEDNHYIFSVMSDMFDGLEFEEDDCEEEGTQECTVEEALILQSKNTTAQSEVRTEPAEVAIELDEDVVKDDDEDDYDIPSWRGVDDDCDSDSDSCNSYDTDDDLYDNEEEDLMVNNEADVDNASCATESGGIFKPMHQRKTLSSCGSCTDNRNKSISSNDQRMHEKAFNINLQSFEVM